MLFALPVFINFVLGSNTVLAQSTTPGYKEMMQDIFNFSCLNCHSSEKTGSARNRAPSTINFDTYTLAAVNAVKANLQVQAGNMPPVGGPLNATRKALFKSWKEAGTPLGTVVDYNEINSKIFGTTCLNCHSTSRSGEARNDAPSNINFDTYELALANSVRANARIQLGTMPPFSGGGALDDSLQTAFQDWINLDTPSGEKVYYSEVKTSIFDETCLLCHNSAKTGAERNGAPNNINFDTYDLAVTNAILANNQLQPGFMPPFSAGGARTLEQKTLFFNWIYADFPENAPFNCDFNADGAVNIGDLISLLLFQRANEYTVSADANADGIFSISDAIYLLISIRSGTCVSSSAALAGVNSSALENSANLSYVQIEYLENVMQLLSLTAEEEQQFRRTLTGSPVSAPVSLPRAFSLEQNNPNPFNPSTTITYTVPDGGDVFVSLIILNLRGQLVKTLVREVRGPGISRVFWDGTDEAGLELSSGVYLYRLSSGDFSCTRKMVLLK